MITRYDKPIEIKPRPSGQQIEGLLTGNRSKSAFCWPGGRGLISSWKNSKKCLHFIAISVSVCICMPEDPSYDEGAPSINMRYRRRSGHSSMDCCRTLKAGPQGLSVWSRKAKNCVGNTYNPCPSQQCRTSKLRAQYLQCQSINWKIRNHGPGDFQPPIKCQTLIGSIQGYRHGQLAVQSSRPRYNIYKCTHSCIKMEESRKSYKRISERNHQTIRGTARTHRHLKERSVKLFKCATEKPSDSTIWFKLTANKNPSRSVKMAKYHRSYKI